MGKVKCLDFTMWHLKWLWALQVESPTGSLLCDNDLRTEVKIWEVVSIQGW